MPHLYEFYDYRPWLKQRMDEIKLQKPFFSFRFLERKLGVNAGHLARVVNSQSHVSKEISEKMAEVFGLEAREKEYFQELVVFCRCKKESEIQVSFERLQRIRGKQFRTVADGEAEFYSKWYHMAIRTLLSIERFPKGKIKSIASRLVPKIKLEEARESVELLLELGLIQVDEEGYFQVCDSYISTGEKWKTRAIRDYQKEMVEQSVYAIENIQRELRDVSTLTLPFDQTNLEVVRERIREFRQELIQLAQENKSDSVYQLNIQLYPSAFIDKSKEEKQAENE